MSKITFTKVRNVKSPTQAYNYPAGTDLYIPEYTSDFYSDLVAKNQNPVACLNIYKAIFNRLFIFNNVSKINVFR